MPPDPIPQSGKYTYKTLTRDYLTVEKPKVRGKPKSFKHSLAFTHKKIALEFFEEWNNGCKASDFTAGSQFTVFWKCKENGHVYPRQINEKVTDKAPCPFCSNDRPSAEYNLATEHPEIAKQWCGELNRESSPDDFLPQSNKVAAWVCQDNPHHVWPIQIYAKTKGSGCGLCSPRRSRAECLIQAEAEAVFGEDQVIGSHKISTEEVDVFIMPNICIEFNGIWHHRLKKRRTKDSQKLRKIQKLGHKVFRVLGEGIPNRRKFDVSVTAKEETGVDPEIVFKLFECLRLDFPEDKRLRKYCSDRKQINKKRYIELINQLNIPGPGKSLLDHRPDIMDIWDHEENGDRKPDNIFAGGDEIVHLICNVPGCKGRWPTTAANLKHRKSNCPTCTRRGIIYVFYHLNTGKKLELTKVQFKERFDVSNAPTTASSKKHGKNSVDGWFCLGEKGGKLRSVESLRLISRDAFVFYRPKDDAEFIGNQAGIVKKYGVSAQSISRVCLGDRQHTNGWHCLGKAEEMTEAAIEKAKKKARKYRTLSGSERAHKAWDTKRKNSAKK